MTCLTTYRVQASTSLSNVTRFPNGIFLKFPRFGRFGLFVLQVVKMSMEQWGDNTDRGKWKYSEKHLSQCHFVHNNSHRAGLGVEHDSTALGTQVTIQVSARTAQ
jgi:hypothetical protein